MCLGLIGESRLKSRLAPSINGKILSGFAREGQRNSRLIFNWEEITP